MNTSYRGQQEPAIHDINLNVRQNDLITIIGPNGSGKTTLLQTIAGFLPPKTGSIEILGLSVSKFGRKLRREIGYVPQNVSFKSNTPCLVKKVVDMGRYGRIGLGKRPNERDIKIRNEALEQVGISDLASQPIGKLSGGQQQKVLLARALAKRSRICLLDEPFNNLDYRAQGEIETIIEGMHSALSLTTLMVLHDFNAIPEICSRAILFVNGSISFDGTPVEVMNSTTFNDAFCISAS